MTQHRDVKIVMYQPNQIKTHPNIFRISAIGLSLTRLVFILGKIILKICCLAKSETKKQQQSRNSQTMSTFARK